YNRRYSHEHQLGGTGWCQSSGDYLWQPPEESRHGRGLATGITKGMPRHFCCWKYGAIRLNAFVAAAVVSATDVRGHPIARSPSDVPTRKELLWAPGTQIPTLQESGSWSIGGGASYAAAVAAAVAANILAAGKTASAPELLAKLRELSRIVDPRDEG